MTNKQKRAEEQASIENIPVIGIMLNNGLCRRLTAEEQEQVDRTGRTAPSKKVGYETLPWATEEVFSINDLGNVDTSYKGE